MPGTGATTYASFAATHEDRLVCSVMSECGLSRAAASRVAAAVLPAAAERTFATCGAAYGWLRVAARHHAAGSEHWAEAADAALGHADSALVALAGLSATDRELLRLRYVDGLLPDALAERTGLSVAEVLAGLDRARAATRAVTSATAAPAVPEPRAPEQGVSALVSAPRAAAVAVLAAAALLTGSGGRTTPPVAGSPHLPVIDSVAPRTFDAPDAAGPAVAIGRRGVAPVPATAAGVPDVVVRDLGNVPDEPGPGPGTCRTRQCTGGGNGFVDELHVAVPKQVGDATGTRELVVKEFAGDYVHLCDVLTPVPAGAARCVRNQH